MKTGYLKMILFVKRVMYPLIKALPKVAWEVFGLTGRQYDLFN